MRSRGSWMIGALLGLTLLASGQTQSPKALDVRQLMTAAEFKRCGLQKLTEEEIENLNGWLTGFLVKAIVATGAQDSTEWGASEVSFGQLEGATIVADDGQFLGKITWNSIDSQSLTNPIGRYGSEISSTSIFNKISRYGSEISSLSPWNSIASTPPRVFKGNKFVGYLTVNKLKTPRIDPHALIGWLRSQE